MPAHRRTALIVEDQPFIGLVASDILRESGFETYHAHDAQAAEGLLAEHPEIDVLVCGAELPGSVDGLEFARRVSQQRPDVQLVVTASGREPSPSELPHGARSLRKSFASGDLLDATGSLAVEA